jgi:hypothetical protein
MGQPRFSRNESTFIIGVPVAWAILLLFHPQGEATSIYADIQDDVTAMLVVHIGMLLFIPLMAAVIYLLVRGIDSTAARICRIALGPFVLFYAAWETLQGIANGILVDEVNALPAAERGAGADLIQAFAESPLVRDLGVFAIIGALGLVTATVAAGVALRTDAGAPVSVAILFGLSGLLITAHPPPFGPIGLLLFVAAFILLGRSESATRTAGPRASAESYVRSP